MCKDGSPLLPIMLDLSIPFSDPFLLHTIEVLHDPHKSYMNEMKQTTIMTPTTCEGYMCTYCHSPVVRSDSPMEFYEDEHVCDVSSVESEMDEDTLNECIDFALDMDYDW